MKIFEEIIFLISFFAMMLFVWMSLISTTTISKAEKAFFTGISGIPHLLILLAIVAISVIPIVNKKLSAVEDKLVSDDKLYKRLYFVLTFFLLFISVLWILLSRFGSTADSEEVQKAAAGLVSGYVDMYLPGEYMNRCQNQIGLALVESFVFRIAGDAYSPLIFQLFNAVCVPLIITALSCFAKARTAKLSILLMGILWFPLILTTSHIYGNVPGVTFALWSYVFLLKYMEDKKIRNAFISVVIIAIACLLKQNFIIFLIAYFLICLYSLLMEKKFSYIAVGIVAVIFSVFLGKGAVAVTEQITGMEMNGGMSNLSYIAMGMQESERAPGWFNFYNINSYYDGGYDTSAQNEIVKRDIKERLLLFKEHPLYALDFYVQKLASQWNEPTLQSIWGLRVHDEPLTGFLAFLVSPYGTDKVLPYFKFFQVLIYFSVLMFLIFEKKKDTGSLLLLTAFIGGVLFHFIWEAKAQYALPYFVLLLPFAVRGLMLLRMYTAGIITGKKTLIEDKKRAKRITLCLIIFLLILLFFYLVNIQMGLIKDTQLYYQYIVDSM